MTDKSKQVRNARVKHAIGDYGPLFYVVAFDPVFGDDLIVAEFGWDDDSSDAKHHRDEAERLANLLADAIGR